MKLHVKKGDNVVVLSGKYKGKTGRVLVASPDKGQIIVEGVNVITRHKKARSAQEQGGLIKDNGNVHSSNVMIICPVCGVPTRIAKTVVDGKTQRTCKKCNGSLDTKAKADKKTKKGKGEEKPARRSKAAETAEGEAPKPKKPRKPKAATQA